MSKWGEGTGVPMSACADPNKPSYDPATRLDDTARKVMWLCENAWDRMTKWERDFCQSVYGVSPLSRKQHVRVWALHNVTSHAVKNRRFLNRMQRMVRLSPSINIELRVLFRH